MSLLQDVHLGLRLLARSPGTTAIAVLSTALSVGATAVVFAGIKSVLLDPLPYAHAGELVLLRSDFPQSRQQSTGDWVLWSDTEEVIRRTRTLRDIGVFSNAVFNLSGDSSTPPEALYGVFVTPSLFPALGVSPLLGRNIQPGEDIPGPAQVMILSYGLWTRRFHNDPAIVGRSVVIDGHACRIVGVMPAGFNFPLRRDAVRTPEPYVEFWAPLPNPPANPGGGVGAVARLRPGVSLAQAREDLGAISRALRDAFPATNRDRVLLLNFLTDRWLGRARNGLWMLMAASLLFLLIGCSNVANLLLARGLARRQEVAIRLALGAQPGRIVRQLLTESCLVALLGGIAGYALTALAWAVLWKIAPVSIPRLSAARADSSTLLFALTIGTLNGILFGIFPALRMSRAGLATRGSLGAARDRFRSSLVAAQVAVSVILVVIGGQLLGAFYRLITTDPGFQADHVLASVVLPVPGRYRNPDDRAAFYKRMVEAARALPGVESAGTVDALPFSGENHGGFVSDGSEPSATRVTAEVNITGGEYLQTMGFRLLAGRWFLPNEMDAANDSAIVSQHVAERLWPGASALGRRVCLWCTPDTPPTWKRVVGVVADASHTALDSPEIANVYFPAGAMRRAQFLVLRTSRPSGEMAQALRRAIAAIDPNQPVLLSATMRELISDSVADRRFIVILLTALGGLALATSAAGIYGVVSYATSRRTREIGLRMAVGATPGQVLALIFRQSGVTIALGLGIGLGAAGAAMRSLRAILPGFDATQPLFFVLGTVLVVVTAGLACWAPALRAARIDPVTALRQD